MKKVTFILLVVLGLVIGTIVCVLHAQSFRTFYISTSGSDSNSGTTKSSPWRHCPNMTGATVSYTHSAGDHFIFKGGETWTAAQVFPSAGGSAATPDYYGVDQSWYTGASWSRPKLDFNYAFANGFAVGSLSYITLDNLELCHVQGSAVDYWGLISGGAPHHLTMSNLYLHGWNSTGPVDGAHGGVIFSGYGGQIETVVLDHSEIENSEKGRNGLMCRMVGTIKYSHLHHNTSAVLYPYDFDHNHMHDITGNPFDGVAHPNGCYLDLATIGKAVGYLRNSTFHDNYGGSNMAYLNPRDWLDKTVTPNVRHGVVMHCYNNLFYGAITTQGPISVDSYAYGDGSIAGSLLIHNNTIVVAPDSGYSDNAIRISVDPANQRPKLNVLVARNNHVIRNSGGVISGGSVATTLTVSNNLSQTLAQATAQGFTLASLFSPGSGSASTVDAGIAPVAPANIFTSDLIDVTRPQGAGWDIGAYEYGGTPVPTASPTPTPTATPTATPTPTPPLFVGLGPFNPVDMRVTPPFAVSGTSVSQAVQTTDPNLGGQLAFRFTAPTAGLYRVSVLTNAPADDKNSVFIDVDTYPTTPNSIWDIPVTVGLQARVAANRGNGTFDAAQYDPKDWNLTADVHTIFIVGREVGVVVDKVSVVLATPTPTPTPTTPTPTPATPTPTPTPTPSPNPPANPNPSNGATSVSVATALNWNGTADTFDIVFDPLTPPVTVAGASVTSNTCTIPMTPLHYSTTYYWQVTATNGGGSNASPIWSFTTTTAPSAKPVITYFGRPTIRFTPSSTQRTVLIKWTADDMNVSGYSVLTGTTSGTYNKRQNVGLVHSATLTMKTRHVRYYATVRANYASGHTETSTESSYLVP